MITAPNHDFKALDKKLKARHEAGECLSLLQVMAYQEAMADTDKPETVKSEAA